MDREVLIRKLNKMLDIAAQERTWGSIELELRDGVPVILREAKTEKLQSETERLPRDSRYQKR